MSRGIITRHGDGFTVRVGTHVYIASVYALAGKGSFGQWRPFGVHIDHHDDNQRGANRAARYVFAHIMPGSRFRVVRVYRRTDLPGTMRFEVRDLIPA